MNKKYYISLVVLCIGILVAGAVYFFMFQFVWKKGLVIATYKNDIVFADQKKQYAEKMIVSFEESREEVDAIQNLFIKKQGEVEFIEFLEQTAKDQNLEVKIDAVSLVPSDKNTLKGVEYLLLRFSVVGAWFNVWNFSQMIEVFPYAVDITSLAFIHDDTIRDVKNSTSLWKGVYTIKVLKKK